MAYCPSCSFPVEEDVKDCPYCGAQFGPGSVWKPTQQPSGPIPTEEQLVQRPQVPPKSLVAGPLIAVGWLILIAAITVLAVWPHAIKAFEGLVILSALLIVVGQSKTRLHWLVKCLLIFVQFAVAFILLFLSLLIIGCLVVKC